MVFRTSFFIKSHLHFVMLSLRNLPVPHSRNILSLCLLHEKTINLRLFICVYKILRLRHSALLRIFYKENTSVKLNFYISLNNTSAAKHTQLKIQLNAKKHCVFLNKYFITSLSVFISSSDTSKNSSFKAFFIF